MSERPGEHAGLVVAGPADPMIPFAGSLIVIPVVLALGPLPAGA